MPENHDAEPLRFLKRRQLLTVNEINRLVRVFVDLGVRKIRLTGGEPLMRDDLAEIVRTIAAIPEIEDLALTTNGLLLAPLAGKLADAGLHRVTISLDSLDEDVFRVMSGGRGELRQSRRADASGCAHARDARSPACH